MKRYSSGMSLLEATIVLAVTAILTTLAVGAFGSVQEHGEMSGESHKLLVLLRKARTMALVTGVRQGVYIGGSSDSVNNGSTGKPDLRNQIAHFRKNGIGSTSTDFESSDRILAAFQLPAIRVRPGEVPQSKIQFRYLQNNAQGSIRIVFDEEGNPTVNIVSAGGSQVEPFPDNGTGALYFIFRSTQKLGQTTTGFDTDATRRCVSLEAGGEARILRAPSKEPWNTCL